jgi:GNAT superfamily N-acetyltransferase
MAYYEVRREGDGESPVGYLVYLATDPGYRGQGMGTLLYREIVARMFAAGCRAVVFEVEIPGEVGRFCPEDGEMARRRMFWYRRNGARCLGGTVAVAGIGGQQPLPEAVMIHARPGDPAEHCADSALACARVALGASAVERTNEPLVLS